MGSDVQFDYTTVGHVTVDVMEDGSRSPGGTAFYSALQAARLGLRTLILTRGVPEEIEELLQPYCAEVELQILPAEQTTTLATFGSGASRTQRVLGWAGPIQDELRMDTAILHLAPVARELPERWLGTASFVGLTPQGLLREWPRAGGEISLAEPELTRPAGSADRPTDGGISDAGIALARSSDAIVVSENERRSCRELIAAAAGEGAVVAVTAGPDPNQILLPDGTVLELAVAPLEEPWEDLGAGDVFAAAFFASLADGARPETAAEFANAAAAVRMRGTGAAAIGDRTAIERRRLAVEATGGLTG